MRWFVFITTPGQSTAPL